MISKSNGISSFNNDEIRTPPFSEEAERGLLGSILLDFVDVMDRCISRRLKPECFYLPNHRVVYETMFEMHEGGHVIDIVTVADRLRSKGVLDKIGGVSFLEVIVESTPTAAHADYYIELIKEKYILRKIIETSREAENMCYQQDVPPDKILSIVEHSLFELISGGMEQTRIWKDVIDETMNHIEKVIEMGRGLSGISTGFLNLDAILHGLRRGEMIVLAARPSMGKTSLAMNIVENVALGKGDPENTRRAVGIFSLEMSAQLLALRMLCSHARLSSFKVASGIFSYRDEGGKKQTDHAKLVRSADILSKAKIYIDDSCGLDISEIVARARMMKRKYQVELIVVDYLQLINARDVARQGRQQETAYISSCLKGIAKELNIPVLVISQLSRAPEHREAGRPRLSDLRDSGAIEQDADVVMMLRRPCKYPEDEEYEDKTLAIVEVVKHRNGPTGEVRLNFDEETTTFTDRADEKGFIPVAYPDQPDDYGEEEQ